MQLSLTVCNIYIFLSNATVWMPMEYHYLLDYGNEFYCSHTKFQDPFWSTQFVTVYFARSVCQILCDYRGENIPFFQVKRGRLSQKGLWEGSGNPCQTLALHHGEGEKETVTFQLLWFSPDSSSLEQSVCQGTIILEQCPKFY